MISFQGIHVDSGSALYEGIYYPRRISCAYLDVEAELLQALEQGLFVARHKCFHVRIDV